MNKQKPPHTWPPATCKRCKLNARANAIIIGRLGCLLVVLLLGAILSFGITYGVK